MAERKKKVCSFCGRGEHDVKLLISGMNGYICDIAWHRHSTFSRRTICWTTTARISTISVPGIPWKFQSPMR